MPTKPLIDEAVLDLGSAYLRWRWDQEDHKSFREYDGPIAVGMVFAWEPELAHAREIVIVCQIDERKDHPRWIWTMPLDSPLRFHAKTMTATPKRWRRAMTHLARDYIEGAPVGNPEYRFRQAVVPTMFNPQEP